jgi:quinohemoprotein ethanol dehydrogenase
MNYTATQHMILADMEIGGKQRKVIMQAPINGFFYVLDRQTGEAATPRLTTSQQRWTAQVRSTCGS